MNLSLADPTLPSTDLVSRWHTLTATEPGLRMRDAAARLGVSEAELVAARCGNRVTRLDGPWGNLIRRLPELGTVMVLTRNEHVVHEKTGQFGEIQIFPKMGLVLNRDIDLRIFLNHWQFGFAVTEATADGERDSLQFFAADGTAVHKIYLRDDAGKAALAALVEAHRHADQTALTGVAPPAAPCADRPDSTIDQASLRQDWLALEDVHDFQALLERHGAGRVQALRLVGKDLARPVAEDAFQTTLTLAGERNVPIMIFVGSPGVIQIHTGPVCHLKRVGAWFNVLDPGFNLHLREDSIASAWVVRKPTRDGTVTSLEIYDAIGQQLALMFGERKPGEAEREDWRLLCGELAQTPEAAP